MSTRHMRDAQDAQGADTSPAAQTSSEDSSSHRQRAAEEQARLGMWIFLATELLFFGGLFLAYLHGRSHWPQGFAQAGQHTDLMLGTVNTALLLSSSALVALALPSGVKAARRRRQALFLGLAAGLGLAFLVIKGVEYHHEWLQGLLPGQGFRLAGLAGAQLFFMLYFVMTGIHALHLLLGIIALGVLAWGAARQAPWVVQRRIEGVGLYWHFVDVVWILLYPLLYLMGRAA